MPQPHLASGLEERPEGLTKVNHHKFRHSMKRRKRLIRLNQKGKWVGCRIFESAARCLYSHRNRDGILTGLLSYKRNMVSPMSSRLRVGRTQGRYNVQGVKESGESERRTVMVRIGQYPHRKMADFQKVINGKLTQGN